MIGFIDSKLIRVSRREPCSICDKPDWCSFSEDGALAICMRVADGSTSDASNGGYIHVLRERERDYRPVYTSPKPQSKKPDIAPIARRHEVYTALLDGLTLSGKHADNLLARGLSDTEAARNLYATVPDSARDATICTELAGRFDLVGVPGFYRDGDRWRLVSVGVGYYVPVRDLANRIQALQTRRDEGEPRYLWLSSRGRNAGASSGAPAHWAAPHRLAGGEAIITEGALKAGIVAQHTRAAVIGLAGVTAWSPTFGGALRGIGVTRAQVAFDADWRAKPGVRGALQRLIACLRAAKIEATILDWEIGAGKGLDDVLAGEVTL